jgi:hypothetical protein
VEPQSFSATVAAGPRGRVFVPLPFDPDAMWGARRAHHVHGTVNGRDVRAVVEAIGGGRGIVLGSLGGGTAVSSREKRSTSC